MNNRVRLIVSAIVVVIIIIILLMLRCGRTKGKTAEQAGGQPGAEATVEPVTTPAEGAKEGVETTPVPGSVKGIKIEVKKDPATGNKFFEATKGGKTILTRDAGEKTEVYMNLDGKNPSLPKAGSDLTGDGKSDVVMQLKSEKDSCSNMYELFSVENDMKLVSEIKGLADGAKFTDLDGDKVPEVLGKDCTFLDWWAAFGSAPAPTVILKFDGTKYVLDQNLMRKDPPTTEEMQAYADKNKDEFITYIWKYMLDLIYTGNGEKAWEFYDMVEWNDEWAAQLMDETKEHKTGDKQEFLDAFKEHLSTSVYWDQIKKFNRWEMLDVEM